LLTYLAVLSSFHKTRYLSRTMIPTKFLARDSMLSALYALGVRLLVLACNVNDGHQIQL